MLYIAKKRVIGLALAATLITPLLSGVICEIRKYHGDEVMCCRSGLIGVAKSCGTLGFERVFAGKVTSSIQTGKSEKRLTILPEEVFLGNSEEVTAIAEQACIETEINAGDRWLFYLYQDKNKKMLVLSYDGPSRPLSNADNDLSMLRSLASSATSGALIGTVKLLPETESGTPVPLANHKVIAKNDKRSYTETTNDTGHFQFILPEGTYEVSLSSEYGLREVQPLRSMLPGSIPVEKGQCWEHNFVVTQAQHPGRR